MNTATKTGINDAKNFRDKYGKNLIDKKNKELILLKQMLKNSSKSAEATRDLIGNKITDKITSLGKSKNKEKENEINEPEEIIIPPEKRQQIINDLRLF